MYKSIHVRKYALIANCLLLKPNRKLRKLFLSPKLESGCDRAWVANRLLLNYKAASQFNIYLYALIFKVIGIKLEKFPILIQKLY